MAKKHFSRRARILKRILDWINRGTFHDFGEFMVLGNVGVFSTVDDEDPEDVQIHLRALSEDDVPKTEELRAWDDIIERMSQLNTDFQGAAVYRTAKERTALTSPHEPTIESHGKQIRAAFEELSSDAKALIRNVLQDIKEVSKEGKEASSSHDSTGFLDEYYSKDVLRRLEKIVQRVSLLEAVKTPKIPSESVEKYFEEAHRCFLYGFPIATAVLCRAVLAARLEELRDQLDPNGTLKQEVEKAPPGKTPSEYKLLIKRAAQEGLLDESRPLVGGAQSPHWAEPIIEAGNLASHNLEKFNKQYSGDEGAAKVS